MSDEMYRQRIKSLEEHTDKLVERNDQLRKELEWVGDLNRALVDGHEKAVREVVRICYALGDGEDCPKNADDAVDWVVALKAELAGVIEGHKAQIDMLAQVDFDKDRQIANLKRIVAERDAKIEQLWADLATVIKGHEAQVAELQANNAALTALLSQWLDDDDNAEDWHGRTGHDVM